MQFYSEEKECACIMQDFANASLLLIALTKYRKYGFVIVIFNVRLYVVKTSGLKKKEDNLQFRMLFNKINQVGGCVFFFCFRQLQNQNLPHSMHIYAEIC